MSAGVSTGPSAPRRSPAVLVVSGEEGIRERVTAALREGDIACEAVGTAADVGPDTNPARPIDAIVFVLKPAGRGGDRILEELRGRASAAPLVAVAPAGEEDRVRSLVSSGLDGAVLEPDLESTLVSTLHAVLAGQLVVPRKLGAEREKPVLSSREKQILGMVVLGLPNSEIASRLVVAESTVKSHLHSAYRKLGVRSRHEAAARILDPAGNLGTGILSISGS